MSNAAKIKDGGKREWRGGGEGRSLPLLSKIVADLGMYACMYVCWFEDAQVQH